MFSVQGLASRVQSPASRVQRSGSSVLSPASRVQSPAPRVQRPESSVQSPASRVQHSESSVQSPVSNSCVQSPGIPVCPIYLKALFTREIDNANFYFLIFLVKARSENSISIPIHPGIICFWIWLFGGAGFQEVKRERRGGGRALMNSIYLKNHRWYDVEKLTVIGNSNSNLSFSGAQQNILC